jgi:hypothetical protein
MVRHKRAKAPDAWFPVYIGHTEESAVEGAKKKLEEWGRPPDMYNYVTVEVNLEKED